LRLAWIVESDQVKDVTILNEVLWHTEASQCPLFAAADIPHGFVGRGGQPPSLTHAHQVHGCQIIAVDENNHSEKLAALQADGLLSCAASFAVGVKTADCLPLLFASREGAIVLAVHAGWRGYAGGILRVGVESYLNAGGKLADLLVSIGPAISGHFFEVGPEVKEAVIESANLLNDQQLALLLQKGRQDRWHIDLQTAAVFSLINNGVLPNNISVMRVCTRERADLWHSYRRDGKKAGRNWSWVRPVTSE